ncbi:MAG: hypothetical protein JWM97_3128 [Phycisphaerales bacterium]|nr:hypothetical protein [Phycisphaerales bacterium]
MCRRFDPGSAHLEDNPRNHRGLFRFHNRRRVCRSRPRPPGPARFPRFWGENRSLPSGGFHQRHMDFQSIARAVALSVFSRKTVPFSGIERIGPSGHMPRVLLSVGVHVELLAKCDARLRDVVQPTDHHISETLATLANRRRHRLGRLSRACRLQGYWGLKVRRPGYPGRRGMI